MELTDEVRDVFDRMLAHEVDKMQLFQQIEEGPSRKRCQHSHGIDSKRDCWKWRYY